MANRFGKESDGLFYLDGDEIDAVRSVLVYILMKNTSLDKDEIYAYIFGKGKRIIWN